MKIASVVRVLLLLGSVLSAVPAGRAQMQVFAKYEGAMAPVIDCNDTDLYVVVDGDKEKTGYDNYTIRPAGAFGDGFVEISNIKVDLDPLRSATAKERSDPKSKNFRFEADVTADRDMKPAFAMLTFVSQGSVGTWFVPLGRLHKDSRKHVSVAFRDRVDSVGKLHVFSGGAEVKSSQVKEAYNVKAYYASLVRHSGVSALELLKLNEPFPYVLSKDGRLLATLRDRDTYYAVVVYDLDAGKMLREVKTEDHDSVIRDIHWVSDHEIAYLEASGWVRDYFGYWYRSRSVLTILDVNTGSISKLDEKVGGIIEVLKDQPDVLVLYQSGSVYKYNIRTGRSWDLENPEGGEFYFDDNGNTRVEVRVDGETEVVRYRPHPGDSWRNLDDTVKTPGLRFNNGPKDVLDRVAEIQGIGPDGDTLYISTRLGHDLFQLDAFSMSSGTITKTIAAHPVYDLSQSDYGLTRLLFQKNGPALIGMIYEAEKPAVIWLDPKYRAVQQAIDGALPGTVNLPLDWSSDGNTFIYFSKSDRDPGTYYIFRPAKGLLAPMLALSDRLKGRKLASTEAFDFQARDGATVHAYITYPPESSGPVPLVVDIHGGPMARDDWGFDPESQFLATRGYAVLKVNYRGSSGYGAKYQRAGLKSRLDTVVIDDIADATRFIIKQGKVDPARVGAIGASFGGWATYMCLIRYPDLYRTGVVTAGVAHWRSDLKKDRWKSDRKYSYEFWQTLLDDQGFKNDEPLIDPYLRAAELKQPIYIMQGEADPVVDSDQARMMVKKLQQTNPNVESLFFPDTGHTSDQWSFTDKVRRLNEEAGFLDRQLKPAAPAAAASTAAAH